jgi:hypothetical protein
MPWQRDMPHRTRSQRCRSPYPRNRRLDKRGLTRRPRGRQSPAIDETALWTTRESAPLQTLVAGWRTATVDGCHCAARLPPCPGAEAVCVCEEAEHHECGHVRQLRRHTSLVRCDEQSAVFAQNLREAMGGVSYGSHKLGYVLVHRHGRWVSRVVACDSHAVGSPAMCQGVLADVLVHEVERPLGVVIDPTAVASRTARLPGRFRSGRDRQPPSPKSQGRRTMQPASHGKSQPSDRRAALAEKRRSRSDARAEASRDPRDKAKAGLLEAQSPDDERERPPERHLMPAPGPATASRVRPPQPSGRGALPSEGSQRDEWDAYVTLGRTTATNAGSPTWREPHGHGVPIGVVRFTPAPSVAGSGRPTASELPALAGGVSDG